MFLEIAVAFDDVADGGKQVAVADGVIDFDGAREVCGCAEPNFLERRGGDGERDCADKRAVGLL